MAQKQLTLLDNQRGENGNDFVYNPKHMPPQSQDPFGMDLGLHHHRSPMQMEYLSIITATLDDIINSVNIQGDEIRSHTSLVMNEIRNHTTQVMSPDCPEKQETTKKHQLQAMLQMRTIRPLVSRFSGKQTTARATARARTCT